VRSLRRTLVVALVAAVTAATAAGALATYRVARGEIDAIFDYHLRQLALAVRDQALGLSGAAPRPARDVDFVVQIFGPYGVRVYASSAAPDLPPPSDLGFATLETEAGRWRAYAIAVGPEVIQVAQPLAVRGQLAFGAAARTLRPLLFLLPVLALAVWSVVGRALAPLDRLARGAAARSAATLAPFPEAGAPEEVLPLVRSLNGLLGRLDAALAAQRAFVADAAHELRTPLAALKVQAQLAARAADPAARAAAMRDLEAGLDRATHVVAQLLTLARAEPGAGGAAAEERVALGPLVAQAVADHAPLAEAKGVDLGATRCDGRALVRGDPAALRTLLANLVDNAIRYTPRGGRVDVAAGADGGRAFLEVSDSGPGIPAAERERVFARFYRRPGAAEGGSGLGLAIVRAIAARHGAAVSLGDAPGGGLVARVELAAVEPAPGEVGAALSVR
jgi:two-component system, OmpR family, sensor kinase